MTRLNYHVQLIPHGQKVSKGYKGLVNLRFPNPVGRTACTSFLSSKTSLKMVNWFSFKVIFSLPTALGRHVWFCGYTCAIQPEVRYFRTCNRSFMDLSRGTKTLSTRVSQSSKRHMGLRNIRWRMRINRFSCNLLPSAFVTLTNGT